MKILKLFLLSILSLFLVCGCSEDEESSFGGITGIVTNANSNEIVSGAIVTLSPNNSSVQTDAAGSFSFSDLEPGTYTVQVKASNYETTTAQVSVVAGMITKCDVSLTPTSQQASISVSTSTITFDKGVNELTFTIKNTGKSGAVSWSISGVTVDWLTILPRSGSTAQGSTSTVKVSVDRTKLSETATALYTSFIVEGTSFSQAITVVVNNVTTGGNEGTATPTTGSISGTITDASTGKVITGAKAALSPSNVSMTTGSTGVYTLTDLTAGVYTLTVTATNYVTKTTQVTVVAGMVTQCDVALTTESSGSSDNTGGNSGGTSGSGDNSSTTTEDYSSAKITSCDEKIKIELLSCKRNDDAVTLSFRMTNTGLGDISSFYLYGPGGTKTTIWTDDNQQYYSASVTFNNETSGYYSNSYTWAPFPELAPCSGSIKIKDVSATAKRLNVKLGVMTTAVSLDSDNIKFYNIPIY
jgi:hypothetical protein